ncbi:MAG TPA: DUF4188 domain-containing protein [Nakamurella sp.]
MTRIDTRRMTHRHEGPLVVFHIGMTINKWHRPDLWWPTFAAMPGMLAELSKDPDSGLLGYRLLFGRGGPTLIQYWASTDKLYAYASAPGARHRPAWAAFNRRARKARGAVGIFHETYVVERAETVYVSTPVMGLAAATEPVPVGARSDQARQRLADGATAAPVGGRAA